MSATEILDIISIKDAGIIDDTFDQSHTITVAITYSNSKNGPWTNYTSLTAYNDTELNSFSRSTEII